MTITLYRNNSENNKLDKNLTTILTLTGNLRAQTSIIEPTLEITAAGENIVTSNYLYIQEFERYYFIKDIVSIRNNVWEIRCHVDVLKTYLAQIKAQTAIIKRQENMWNYYLNDGHFDTYQNPYITTQSFPLGFNKNSDTQAAFNFAIIIAGKPPEDE